jgi:hypothetical protein
MALLCDQLGIDRDYIDQRVQTFFINGRAVDQVEQIQVGNRDVIALSAAMPGLAGATLRKGGMFAGFRQAISYTGGSGPEKAPQQTVVTFKLFNLVARELAAQILHTGVWVKGPRLAEFLQQLDDNALTDSGTIKWNDQPRDPGPVGTTALAGRLGCTAGGAPQGISVRQFGLQQPHLVVLLVFPGLLIIHGAQQIGIEHEIFQTHLLLDGEQIFRNIHMGRLVVDDFEQTGLGRVDGFWIRGWIDKTGRAGKIRSQ